MSKDVVVEVSQEMVEMMVGRLHRDAWTMHPALGVVLGQTEEDRQRGMYRCIQPCR